MLKQKTQANALKGSPSQHLCVAVVFVGRLILSGVNHSRPRNSFIAKPMKGEKTKNKSFSRHICMYVVVKL